MCLFRRGKSLRNEVDYAIVGATGIELRYLYDQVSDRKQLEFSIFNFVIGRISDKKVIIVPSGIGMTNAAVCATALFEDFGVGTLISVGIGGAYEASGIKPGDVAIATEEVYADMGVCYDDRIGPLDEIDIPLLLKDGSGYFNCWPVSKRMLKIAEKISSNLRTRGDFSVHFGRFATVAGVSGDLRRAGKLGKKFGVVCENMEGAALAHVAKLYDVEFFECRGISNVAGVRNKEKWEIEKAAKNSQWFLVQILRG